jgi:hypothetical protein
MSPDLKTSSSSTRPIVACTDWEGLDIEAVSEFQAAGWEVRLIGSDDPGDILEGAKGASAFCIGHPQDRLRAGSHLIGRRYPRRCGRRVGAAERAPDAPQQERTALFLSKVLR